MGSEPAGEAGAVKSRPVARVGLALAPLLFGVVWLAPLPLETPAHRLAAVFAAVVVQACGHLLPRVAGDSPLGASAVLHGGVTLLLVADQDRETPRANGSWHSTLRRGSLCLRTPTARDAAPSFSVSWVDEVPLTSPLNAGGRGMELSELVWCAGRLT